MKKEVYACIIAAGTSSRMGKTKQLLPINGKPMLQHVIDNVLSLPFTKVFTIIGHDNVAIQSAIQVNDPRFQWVINKEYKMGQSTSLKVAFKHTYPEHMMVFLGDMPFIKEETINMVWQLGSCMTEEATTSLIVRPTYRNNIGHPVFIADVSKEMTNKLEGDKGFKEILSSFERKAYIPINDAAIISDIDTMPQYKEMLEKLESCNHTNT